ncbi:glycogen debranching enzyme [Clostridium sp. MF28]|uniref:glycogen debranching protein GlgX n=1 Tax=Clostridium TaxID=1485 RepID=UPI000B3FB0FF|nr:MULTISPECIES: glycogen debranching protein GlgX [Clostridium]AVK46612.1 glycogen debranching enzyme [Clostridium sp. MF28]OVE68530.1 glycogen debranching enzyme GlgX [Clostridium diolis]PSM59584.1 glycogen debranching enzyme GlgX [Clostridium diolis]
MDTSKFSNNENIELDINTLKNTVNFDEFVKTLQKNLIPTDEFEGFKIRPGFYLENGAVVIPGGVNFTIHSQNATSCKLLLFKPAMCEPYAVIPFPEYYRIGNVYSMIVLGLDIEEFEYAYSVDGPYIPERGLVFNSSKYLLDPYSKAIAGQSVWGTKTICGNQYKSRVVSNDFDWGNSKRPLIPMKDLIIYELHVRGFTKHPSSKVNYPGTFAGLAEKIPYLKELGINAVELMPIFEFDEMLDARYVRGNLLCDYWGYNPVCFFAPNTSYTAGIERNKEGDELKSLIKKFHEDGIEVILDVVFNHTAEGNEYGPYISFKGFDNNVYYMLTTDGKYYNFSGCGNTLNCNHPIVHRMILDCLRYWVTEYRVDGFRFDLASILGRNEDGSPMNNPPLLQSLAFDPILANTKLIAEAWDAGGLYQVGSFPSWKRWCEWNGKYRDDIRRFLKGDSGLTATVAERITGSYDLYNPDIRGKNASVNFITCHDGFTLYDLYSYNDKHNEENGWNNTDGENNNNSWNCGAEGETDDENIIKLRRKLIKNACAVLLSSQGAPMLLSGDEFGNTQFGNNNPYCQDNEISWLNWSLLYKNHDLFTFFKNMINFRKRHPAIKDRIEETRCGLPPVSKHGIEPWYLDPSDSTRTVGIMFAGWNKKEKEDDIVYLCINAHWETQYVRLPELPIYLEWRIAVNTAMPFGEDISDSINEMLQVGDTLEIEPRSVMILIGISKI